MKGFRIITQSNEEICFDYYLNEAPVTCREFHQALPFTKTFFHARVSGQEIWIDNAPLIDCIQENASVFTEPGEVVFGPAKPARTKTAGCLGFYYGEGKGLDAANIFARVVPEDLAKLKSLGDAIWKTGAQELTIAAR